MHRVSSKLTRGSAAVLGASPASALLFTACAQATLPPWTASADRPVTVEPVVRICDAGDAEACERAGDARVAEGDFVAANPYYDAACRAGRPAACNHLGFDFNVGLGVPRDPRKAFEVFTRSCKLEDPSGCASLAILLAGLSGATPDAPRDPDQALALAKKWCDRGSGLACDAYGRMLSASHDPRAPDYWRLACDMGPRDRDGYQGCTHLAQAKLDGDGVAADVEGAIAIASRACDAGMPAACNLVGWTYWDEKHVPRDAGKAVTFFRRACDRGDEYGCTNLGVRYLRGEGVEPDRGKALRLFQWACDRGFAKACDDVKIFGAEPSGASTPPSSLNPPQ